MLQSNITQLKELLGNRKNIVIVTHKNPDGDAIGSSLGLYNFLIRKKHHVTVITPNDYPTFLHWLPGNNKVMNSSVHQQEAKIKIEKANIIFCLDFNGLSRISNLQKFVKKSRAIKILIDHHLQPEHFADYYFHDKKASSTSELVFDFISALGEKQFVNKKKPAVGLSCNNPTAGHLLFFLYCRRPL